MSEQNTQTKLVEQTTPSIVEKYETADESSVGKSGAAALLAVRHFEIDATAAANEWDQDRIDQAKAEAERSLRAK